MSSPSTASNYTELWVQLRQRLAPAQLSNLQTNGDLIAHYIHRNKLNPLSVDDALLAVWALHEADKILWNIDPVAPVTPSHAQKVMEDGKRLDKAQAKAYQDAKKQNMDNVARVDAAVAQQEAKAKAAAKELASLKAEIMKEVNGYFVGHPSGNPDYSKTAYGRQTLVQVLREHAKVTVDSNTLVVDVVLTKIDQAKRALQAVGTAKSRL